MVEFQTDRGEVIIFIWEQGFPRGPTTIPYRRFPPQLSHKTAPFRLQVKQSDPSVPLFITHLTWLQGKCSRPTNYHRMIRNGEIQLQVKSGPSPTCPHSHSPLEIRVCCVFLSSPPYGSHQTNPSKGQNARRRAEPCPGLSKLPQSCQHGSPAESLLLPSPEVWDLQQPHPCSSPARLRLSFTLPTSPLRE